MSKKSLENLKDALQYEVDAIAKKGEIDKEALENLYKLTCTMKNIDKLMMSEEGNYSMNSYNSYNGYARNSYENSMRNSYDNGNSMDGRRGRDGDSDGHYSEDGGSYRRGRDSRGRYTSREYSRHDPKEKMIMKLENMLEETTNAEDRMAIEKCLDQLEK